MSNCTYLQEVKSLMKSLDQCLQVKQVFRVKNLRRVKRYAHIGVVHAVELYITHRHTHMHTRTETLQTFMVKEYRPIARLLYGMVQVSAL